MDDEIKSESFKERSDRIESEFQFAEPEGYTFSNDSLCGPVYKRMIKGSDKRDAAINRLIINFTIITAVILIFMVIGIILAVIS